MNKSMERTIFNLSIFIFITYAAESAAGSSFLSTFSLLIKKISKRRMEYFFKASFHFMQADGCQISTNQHLLESFSKVLK